MDEYNLLDTKSFDSFLSTSASLNERYDNIRLQYQSIVQNLIANWKGRGADAFYDDSQKVISNLIGIQDILKTMCDTLRDCRDIFGECDTSLGNANREVDTLR